MKILLTMFLFFLLTYTTATEASCVDTTGPIYSTSTKRKKHCLVIQSKLISANNDNDEADFNKVKKSNCGPGSATWQWRYVPGNCTCARNRDV